jgi:hypothetical protein
MTLASPARVVLEWRLMFKVVVARDRFTLYAGEPSIAEGSSSNRRVGQRLADPPMVDGLRHDPSLVVPLGWAYA